MPIINPLGSVSSAIWPTTTTTTANTGLNISQSYYIAMVEQMRRYQRDREPVTVADESFRTKALAIRLHLTQGEKWPFDALYTAHSGEKVFCFIVTKGQAITLEDESVLFPSDTLITQLRMLME